MSAMPYVTIKTLIWISIFKLILSSQDERKFPTFMMKIENCSSRAIWNNDNEEMESDEDLNITFKLFTKNNPQNEYILHPNSNSVKNSTFDPCVGAVFVIVGYVSSLPNSHAVFDLKDELLKQGEYNVVVVDYTKYNDDSIITYIVGAFEYVPSVGTSIANLIKVLMRVTGIKPEAFYLIGHSLGAHIAGVAGKQVPNLGRITGLDAAGPLYRFLSESFKLTNNDAIFVDAIHTNGALLPLGLGTIEAYGDQDYFPNGGTFQPGCVPNQLYFDTFNKPHPIDSIQSLFSCNHDRVLHLYVDSINKCEFLSVLCGSYSDFLEGKCPENTSVTSRMGFHAERIDSLPEYSEFYLQTENKPPFCVSANDTI